MKRIAARARATDHQWILVRQGRKHELWSCGEQRVTVPRHAEINEYTAEGIFKDLEVILGESWWRR